MQIQMKLSDRLKTLSRLVPEGSYFADIGSDHALLPCFVCAHDRNAFAIAGEVSLGPYNSAKETVETYGLSERISVRLGDGLDVLQATDNIDTIIIAGMGGKLITNILKQGSGKLSKVSRLILQPNIGGYTVRKFLQEHDFTLENELILEENNKFYEIIIAERSIKDHLYMNEKDLERQLFFGPILMQKKSAIFLKKWQHEYAHSKQVLQQLKRAQKQDVEKQRQLSRQIAWMEEILQ